MTGSVLLCLFIWFGLQITNVSVIKQYLSFSVWLISLSIISSTFIHVVTNSKILFFTFPPTVHRVPFPWHPYKYLFVVFLITAILTGMRWYFTVILICICLMISDAEQWVSNIPLCVYVCIHNTPFIYIYVYTHTHTHTHTHIYICCCCSVANHVQLCGPMNCSMPGFPVPHYLPELAQVHVHWINDAIQSSHPLLPSSPSAFNLSQHQGPFQWVRYLGVCVWMCVCVCII